MKTQQREQEREITPQFISGFVESDGCFSLIKESRGEKTFWRPTFYITQQGISGPSPLLNKCAAFFGGGGIIEDKRYGCYSMRVNSRQQLEGNVLPHFLQYPLLGDKRGDFLLFQQACQLLWEGGGKELERLSTLMNRAGPRYRGGAGRPEALRKLPTLHPEYVSGLVQGDGSFYFSFLLNPPRARPNFALGQHYQSKSLLGALRSFFSCGKIYQVGAHHWRLSISSPKDLRERVLPHFSCYPLVDDKERLLELFSRGCEMQREKTGRATLLRLVDLLYDSNCSGKRRRRTREEYLAALQKIEKIVT